jgi:hypothetical protein
METMHLTGSQPALDLPKGGAYAPLSAVRSG